MSGFEVYVWWPESSHARSDGWAYMGSRLFRPTAEWYAAALGELGWITRIEP